MCMTVHLLICPATDNTVLFIWYSLPIDSTGGVSLSVYILRMPARTQCKQTASKEMNVFTGWTVIILEYHMNKISRCHISLHPETLFGP